MLVRESTRRARWDGEPGRMRLLLLQNQGPGNQCRSRMCYAFSQRDHDFKVITTYLINFIGLKNLL